MTYNVKGLPWPVAWGRKEALASIGARLAAMRRQGRQPDVVLLQEAFVDEAKAIGDRAGYPYRITGADAEEPESSRGNGVWYRGETLGAPLDSGLVVLSDLPIVEIKRADFPASACAGYDCLSSKGVLIVTVRTADGERVAVATTHLNSRGASGAPVRESTRAYRKQVAFLAHFLRQNRDNSIPLILAGDFNLGQRVDRLAILPAGLETVTGSKPTEALRSTLAASLCDRSSAGDAGWIRKRARDMQFVFAGTVSSASPVGLAVPFGSEADGVPLSDHMGFTIDYKLSATPQA